MLSAKFPLEAVAERVRPFRVDAGVEVRVEELLPSSSVSYIDVAFEYPDRVEQIGKTPEVAPEMVFGGHEPV